MGRFNTSIFVGLNYHSNMVTQTDEYLLYDFSNILAALGGALGLFIGFSFYDCGAMIVDVLEEKSNKRVEALCKSIHDAHEEVILRNGMLKSDV